MPHKNWRDVRLCAAAPLLRADHAVAERRLRIDDEWYRVDLLFFHRRLRCLVVIGLKLGKFTHADAGQMHLYLNYARENWTHPDETPSGGLVLCSNTGQNIVRYTLDNLPSKVLAKEYHLACRRRSAWRR